VELDGDYFLLWALGGDFTLFESHACAMLLACLACCRVEGSGGELE